MIRNTPSIRSVTKFRSHSDLGGSLRASIVSGQSAPLSNAGSSFGRPAPISRSRPVFVMPRFNPWNDSYAFCPRRFRRSLASSRSCTRSAVVMLRSVHIFVKCLKETGDAILKKMKFS